MKKTSSWLWGGVLIALGVIWGVNALGIARIDIFFPGWWTLFIIVPSLVGLFANEHKSGAIAGLVIGVCFLLSSLGLVSFGILWKLLLPALLILIGFTVIVRGNSNGEVTEKIAKAKKKHHNEGGKHIVEAEVVLDDDEEGARRDDEEDEDEDESEGGAECDEYWSTFSDQQVNYDGKEFTGCKVDAVFGGADVNLRGAKIKNESVLKASSIFGGIIVYVPENVKVEVASTSIFGGVSDKRKSRPEKFGKTLYIEATCVFGGVEIR